ncbi:MAG: phosphotransferase, partial [Chloroflexi bacterium]|nr:phosphotransferase [Chloroflexota bacterium]
LDRAGIELEVVPGNELYLTPDAPSLLAEGHVASLGDGRSVLVELSLVADRPPLFLDDVLFRLQVDGYFPVLAHPERYPFVQRDVSIVERWVEQGVTLQVTAPSLLGEYGTVIRRTAEAALRRNAYALAASDRHHPGAGRSLAKLHGRIADLTDASVANLLLADNPRRVLTGQPTIPPQHRPPDPAGLLGRLFNR